MKGDFSRFIYDERKHYSLVLMQQGRVQLDSDWNEQALLQWIGMQNLAEDIIGEHGGPIDNHGFDIRKSGEKDNFLITKGKYYVNGNFCRNDDEIPYKMQEAYPFPDSEVIELSGTNKYVVYLHVWWRHITSLEDDHLREVALGGPDTTSRIQTVWQVKAVKVTAAEAKGDYRKEYEDFITLLENKGIIHPTTGRLQAQALKPDTADQPCITSPRSEYRGKENQLYRVEIHHSGPGCSQDSNNETTGTVCATFKWSRENGSVVFPILEFNNEVVTLEHLGRDDRFGLSVGDWVEVVDDIYELRRKPENLLKVIEIDSDTMKVTLSSSSVHNIDPQKNALLRRWDHSGETQDDGALPIEEGKWIELEDGVQIQFTEPSDNELAHWYQSGAWWWIPARTITGNVEWPQENGQPAAIGPLDAGDSYAPLALLDPKVANPKDYRRKFNKLAK